MKTIAKIMTVLGFFVLCGTAWANEPIIPDAISHWKFDEGSGTTAYDSAGSNHGTVYGAVWTSGQIAGALSFNGVDDYVATANNIFTNAQLASGATLSAWFKTDSTAYGYIADNEGYLSLGINHSTHPNKLLGTVDGGEHKYYSSSDVNDNLWHHAAIVWNGAGTAILYLDGFEESSGPSGSPKPDLQNRPFVIGVHSSISAYFDGIIDDVRVYDKALSAVEVWRLWSSDPVPPLIELSATQFEFTCFEGGANPNDQILGIIIYGGEVTLNWQITEDCNWLSANPNAGSSTGEVDDVNLSVDISGLAVGTYTCELTISDPNALNNPQIVGITLYVRDNDGQLHVPSEYSTIQAAINAAVTGDTVLVADGTYTGPGNRDIGFLGKAITVRSQSSPENCIIDCNGTWGDEHQGFYFDSGEDTNSVLTGFTITGGYTYMGGGIYCNSSSPTIKNCIIMKNRAAFGGGITLENSKASVIDCLIAGNEGLDDGGGIFIWYDSSSTIKGCTIVGNSSSYDVAGILCYSGEASMINCLVWDNRNRPFRLVNSHGIGSKLNVSYCDIQGGRTSGYVCSTCVLNWGMGNIDADPCLVQLGYWDVNGLWIDGDYYLQAASPCIDTGDPNYIPEPNETDLDGNPRVIGYAVDMGAYEYWPPVEAEMTLTPKALNCNSKGNFIKAHFALPDGFLPEDVDVNTPAWAEPVGVQSEYIRLLGNNPVKLEIAFDRQTFCDAITEPGQLEVTIIGSLTAGQRFYATDSIKIIPPR